MRKGAAGTAVVPWVQGVPNESLVQWAAGRRGDGRRALVVGCGTGEDAEFLAGLGYAVTGFDIAPAANRPPRGGGHSSGLGGGLPGGLT